MKPSPLFHVEELRDVATTNLVNFVVRLGDKEFDEDDVEFYRGDRDVLTKGMI